MQNIILFSVWSSTPLHLREDRRRWAAAAHCRDITVWPVAAGPIKLIRNCSWFLSLQCCSLFHHSNWLIKLLDPALVLWWKHLYWNRLIPSFIDVAKVSFVFSSLRLKIDGLACQKKVLNKTWVTEAECNIILSPLLLSSCKSCWIRELLIGSLNLHIRHALACFAMANLVVATMYGTVYIYTETRLPPVSAVRYKPMLPEPES